MNNGSSAEECLAETKSFARISESHLNGVLKDKKQQTGKKVLKGKEIDYLKAIDEIIVDREGSIQKLEELKTEVMMEESFGAKLKEVFSNWIDSKINDAKNVEPKEGQNFKEYETSYLKRLWEAIDSLMCSEVRSEDDVDAAEVIRKYFFGDDTK
jgi:hypothetical protein